MSTDSINLVRVLGIMSKVMDPRLREQIDPIYIQIGAIVQNSQYMEFSIGFSLTLLK